MDKDINVKITVAYDGTNYYGFQKQNVKKNHVTIEAKLEAALVKIYKFKPKLYYASRTDSGVHAISQVVSFKTGQDIPVKRLGAAVNRWLPEDIRVVDVTKVSSSFNARKSNGKVYIYRIYNKNNLSLFMRHFCFYTNYKLDLSLMRKAAAKFRGKHDFTAFTTVQDKRISKVTCLTYVRVIKFGRYIYVVVKGHNFLHKMVRFIVGALLKVASGKMKVSDISYMLKNKSRDGFHLQVAKPEGLFLKKVLYND